MKKIITCLFVFLICCSCSADSNLTKIGKDYSKDFARMMIYGAYGGAQEIEDYVNASVYYMKNIKIAGVDVVGCAIFSKAEKEGYIQTVGAFLTNSKALKRELTLSEEYYGNNIYIVFFVNLKDDNNIELRFNSIKEIYNHKTGRIIE